MSQRSLVVSLVGGAPGCCENLLILVFSPGRCFPGVLSIRLRGPAKKESSQSKEGFISVCCESLPTLQDRASVATARAWRASAGFFDQMVCYCAAAASVVFAFWYLGTLEADLSAAAAFEGDLGLVSLHSAVEAVGGEVLCESNSKAAAAIDCDSALEEWHSCVNG